MSATTDWISAISNVFAAIGTVGAVAYALFQERIQDWLFPGRVGVSFRDPDGELSYLGTQDPILFFHLRVRNESERRTLRECHVVLTEVSKEVDDGRWQTIPLSVPLPFRWAPSELQPLSIDLHAGAENILDFGWYRYLRDVQATVFEPVLASYPLNFPGRLVDVGKIRYHIEVRANGLAKPLSAAFEIRSDGRWPANPAALANNVSVRRLNPPAS